MPIKVKYGFPRERWHVTMFFQGSRCWNYDQENIEKDEKIPIVILRKKNRQKFIKIVNNKVQPIVFIRM